MTVPSLDQLATDASAISQASPKIRTYATDTVAYLRALEARVAALESQPAPAPSPTPAPTPSPYLFEDTFVGPAGSPPDPTKWVNVDGTTFGGVVAPAKAENAFLDGNGNLVLRITREAWLGKQYAGAMIGTYKYGSGWPPATLLKSFPAPFRYEVRFLLPNAPGMWSGAGWLQNVDRTNTQAIHELDCGECRSATRYGTSQHLWIGSTDTLNETSSIAGPDGHAAFQTMAVEVRGTGNTYFLNGLQVTPHSGATGRFGVQLHNVLGGTTLPTDSGPWDMLIDYVRVSAL